LLIAPIISTQACANNSSNQSFLEDIRIIKNFETQTQVTIDEETIPTERINPGETKTLTAKVDFKYDTPDFFPEFLLGTKIGNWVIFRDTEFGNSVNLSLSVTKKPEWCDVELPEIITIGNIGTTLQENTFDFNVTVNNSALGLQIDEIQIKATFTPEASWGLLESSSSGNFTIEADMVGELITRLDPLKNTTLYFESGETKTVLLEVFNHYNVEILVDIAIHESILTNKYFNASVEEKQIKLDLEETKYIKINITAPVVENNKEEKKYNFQLEPLVVLTPKAFSNQSVVKSPITIIGPTLKLEVEGNLMDIIMLVIYATIILIVLAVVIILVFKRLNR